VSQRALVDLVETATPEASRAFVTLATRLAEEVGGRKVVANEVHLPTIVADERSSKADEAARLLVITRYPSERASELALAKRKEWGPELFTDAIRTYAVNPVRGIEAVLPRILTTTLGLRGKETVPKCDETARLEPLIEASHILGHEPAGGIYEGR